MNPVGRNEPCPCGSGKRFKECHGAIRAPAAPGPTASAGSPGLSWAPQVMREALRAQQSGRVVEAAQKYRRVLAADPSNFDAAHSLSLVEYENGHYDEALALIKHAIQLRPELGTPRHNLRLLESLPLIELEICREVLPRLVSRVDSGFDLERLAAAGSVHVVIGEALGDEERTALARIVAACGAAPVRIWDEAAADVRTAAVPAAKLTADDHPRDGTLVLLGTARSPAAWLPAMHAEVVLLIVTRDEPCAIIDRIDELAAAGHANPGLLCATRALAERLRLPRGATLTPGEALVHPLP
jgi:tetratricopeptide (TPR) repeat protein